MVDSWSRACVSRPEGGPGVGVRPLFTALWRWQATLRLHSFLQTLSWLLLWPPLRWPSGHLLQLSLLGLLSWQRSWHLLQLWLLWTFSWPRMGSFLWQSLSHGPGGIWGAQLGSDVAVFILKVVVAVLLIRGLCFEVLLGGFA